MRDWSEVIRLARCTYLVAAGLLVATTAQAGLFFQLDNLERGKPVQPRPGQVLIFGSEKILGPDGAVLFPPESIYGPRPGLHVFGLGPGGRRTMATFGLQVRDDGTFAAWLPPGDYLLVAAWPMEGHDIDQQAIAVIRLPPDGGPTYTGELVVEISSSHWEWNGRPKYYDIANVTTVAGPADDARRGLEAKFGPQAGTTRTIAWCTQGVPPGPDPGNARSLALLDAGCGSASPSDGKDEAAVEPTRP